jgi:ribonuclease HII
MEGLENKYPGYGFAQHKGYGTPEHQSAIRTLGPCPIHRMSFQFIRELRGELAALFYELKQELQAVESAAALRDFEKKLKNRLPELAEGEQRKIRLMVSRRWDAM